MAFLKIGKKKEEPLENPNFMADYNNPNIPVEQVMSMKQQGYSDEQITQALQQQGFNAQQITDALSQVPYSSGSPYGNQQQNSFEQQYQYNPQSQQPYAQTENNRGNVQDGNIQEIVEVVINEKWNEFSKEINSMVEWREKTEAKIAQLQQQIADIKASVDSTNMALIGKLSEYDKNITDVGTGIKAMEKVFQKVLPSLTDSVNKLERISKKV